MGVVKWFAFLGLPISIAAVYLHFFSTPSGPPPTLGHGWWSEEDEGGYRSEAIKPFKIQLSGGTLYNAWERLQKPRLFESLPDSNFEYGFNSEYMKEVVRYWVGWFDWSKKEKQLNKYEQFKTEIEGIDVHFIHVKPANLAVKPRVLLLLHGWPGSGYEFVKLIPKLTGLKAKPAFELVIPSIPGFGFSEAPHRPGFDYVDAARVFMQLMKRLGHQRYYVHGADWGAYIGRTMAQMGDSVIGLHLSFFPPKPNSRFALTLPIRQLIGEYLPWLVYTAEERANASKLQSVKDQWHTLLRETGYLHLQATRPDSIAFGLNDSPVALAAYLLEKYSVSSNNENRFCADGCLSKHFTLDDVLTQVMIYWASGSIASSMRFYRESLANPQLTEIDSLPETVPVGVASFPNEPVLLAESLVRSYLLNVIQFTHMPEGGHFAALEQPKLLAADIKKFVRKLEKQL